jgi:hypothetical protein
MVWSAYFFISIARIPLYTLKLYEIEHFWFRVSYIFHTLSVLLLFCLLYLKRYPEYGDCDSVCFNRRCYFSLRFVGTRLKQFAESYEKRFCHVVSACKVAVWLSLDPLLTVTCPLTTYVILLCSYFVLTILTILIHWPCSFAHALC